MSGCQGPNWGKGIQISSDSWIEWDSWNWGVVLSPMTSRSEASMLQEWTGVLSLGFQVPISLYKIMDRDMCMVAEEKMVWWRRKGLPNGATGQGWRKLKGSMTPGKLKHLHKTWFFSACYVSCQPCVFSVLAFFNLVNFCGADTQTQCLVHLRTVLNHRIIPSVLSMPLPPPYSPVTLPLGHNVTLVSVGRAWYSLLHSLSVLCGSDCDQIKCGTSWKL